ncbi:benzoyl-CoA 2,3-epoxidase subunit BoxA [Afipia clevelandensis]|uniref:Benzoyl-CoA oxygenase/reductase, BoxA protein n=1 Tax=Afipia clevelandensis ATCC 49720 TaxID=883079 RepID=K8P0W5_9BRAD|nr:benzoyl-CoA 2,3-epoxidase subunit BoxA [Afipia clevelandensis]EKS33300.1 benzoyl-CoA oxygenase/reductase, BoxA protein [Afipia clevelandensis ATCC 49720]
MNAPVTDLIKQHLIDPEICIRCNTCEETCPVDAVTHDGNNYVVDASICNHCMDCISPCPTGSIDNWRVVSKAYSLEEQYSWEELPKQEEVAASSGEGGAVEALEDEVLRLLEEARKGLGGKPVAPHSASKPTVNLYNRGKLAVATVTGNFRLTDANADSDVRHIILDFGDQPFPVLEGQSIGIVAPGTDENGTPHVARLYSVASPRGGEKPNTNNLALTVKREDKGVCSNYLCDLPRGAKVEVTGPFGATFLMPDDPAANIIMICTGTGSAPFRGFTERRRRAMPDAPGRLLLFFGARRPEELPYFGPLQKVPEKLLGKYFCYSRVPDQPRVYVQDRIRGEMAQIAALLRDDKTHVYICGLKGMETGVDEAFADACRAASIDWSSLKPRMRESGRYHVETY